MADEADTFTAASAAEVEETGTQDAGRDPLSEMKTKSVENAMRPLIDQVSADRRAAASIQIRTCSCIPFVGWLSKANGR